jgi:16S rRNA (guanine527-N7)-methyltransferase
MGNRSDLIKQYFPQISSVQQAQFEEMYTLYQDWNEKINVISRKDMDNFYERHVLHSLAIAKVISFPDNTQIVDVGTGGGFPSIPLAVLFPNIKIHAIDSIGKKIKVATEVSKALDIKNLTAEQVRSEDHAHKYDFVVSRAVAEIGTFHRQTKHLLKPQPSNSIISGGYLCLKGGDLIEEFAHFRHYFKMYSIKDWFAGEFFETKKVVHIK